MPNIRIKDIPTTASATSSTDFIGIDGSANGTRKLNAYSPTFGGNLTVSGTGNSSVAGNLGIGETSPVVPLHVKTTGTGTGDFDNAIATLRSTAAGRTITLQFSDTTNQSYISSKSGALNFGVGGATLGMSLSSGGNLTVSGTGTSSFAGSLGIATTSPNKSSFSTAVTVNGATNSGFEVAVGDTRIAGFYAASSIAVLNAFANVPLAFSTNNTTQMQLFANGNLFIGASPTDGGQKLQVAGTVYFSGDLYSNTAGSTWGADSGATGFLVYGAGGGANANKLVLRTNSTTALTLDSSQHFKLTPAVASSITTTQSAPQIRMGSRASGRSNVVLDSTAGRVWSLENTGTSLTVGYSGLDAITIAETTGDATFAGTVKIANTAQIKGVYTTTTTFDFGTIANNDASSVCTLTMTGVSSSDSIIVSPTDGDNFPQFCTVSAVPSGNTVAIRLYNGSGSSRTVGSRSIRVTAIKF